MSGRDVFERAADRWRSRGIQLLPPASPLEVADTFEALGYPLSADVRELYAVVGGFVDYEVDSGLWSLWSLERLRKENVCRGEILLFADYLIRSHCYGFHFEDARVSSVYITEKPERVAASVAEFLEMYLRDPGDVWAWNSDA